MTNDQIDNLVKERDEARKGKDWSRADEIRDQLASIAFGDWRVKLLDEPNGTFWYWTHG